MHVNGAICWLLDLRTPRYCSYCRVCRRVLRHPRTRLSFRNGYKDKPLSSVAWVSSKQFSIAWCNSLCKTLVNMRIKWLESLLYVISFPSHASLSPTHENDSSLHYISFWGWTRQPARCVRSFCVQKKCWCLIQTPAVVKVCSHENEDTFLSSRTSSIFFLLLLQSLVWTNVVRQSTAGQWNRVLSASRSVIFCYSSCFLL